MWDSFTTITAICTLHEEPHFWIPLRYLRHPTCNTVAFYDDQPGIASVKFVLSKSTIVYVRPSVNN